MAKNVSLKIGKHKSRSGGLTKAGREKYNRETGSKLKAPQPEGGPRKKSFCARMSGVKGPAKKPNGKPTRKTLALRKWKC
jgi:ribosomal protein S12